MKILLLLFGLTLPLWADNSFDPFTLSSAKSDPAKSEKQKENSTSAQLLSEVSLIASSTPFTVALKLSHPQGWHSYYQNSGLIGESLKATWTLPKGFSAEYLGWPTPHLAASFGFQTIGYEGVVRHLYEITPPPHLAAGTEVILSVDAHWQICNDTGCIPEQTSQSLSLKTGSSEAINENLAAEFKEARKHYPSSVNDMTLSATEADDVISLTISPAAHLDEGQLRLFDEDGQISVQEDPKVTKQGGVITISLPRNLGNDFADAGPVKDRLRGILTDGKHSYLIDTSLQPTTEKEATSVNFSSLLGILGGMFIGGLVLNLMPCVFPVIGIKIMSFVEQAGHDRKKIMAHGFAFAGGVFASFWILCLIMLLGGIKNWGGQLESPAVMFTLIIVMLLLAMNMYGVFEIGAGATGVGSQLTRKNGLSGSFFSGVLATVVATPCSAPFLGAALGAAVALPTFWFFTSFTFMALGLSLPYLTLSAFPQLVRKLPRPGAWMESFKQGMSFLLFATVGYLLWVYSAQVFEQEYGQKGLFVMIGLSLIAASGWVWGRWTAPIKKTRTKWIARILALALFTTGVFLGKPGKTVVEDEQITIEWLKWSKEKEQAFIAEGRPVFVDFTAKWCLTCQVNKKNAYTPEVVALMKSHNVVFLKGDKTSSHPKIDAELKRLKRSAIPVNVLYAPSNPSPHITPEVLTEGYMIDLIKETLDK